MRPHSGVISDGRGWGVWGGLWAINYPPSYLLQPRCIIKTYTFKVPRKGGQVRSCQDHWAGRQVPCTSMLCTQVMQARPASESTSCTLIQLEGTWSVQRMKQSWSLSWMRWEPGLDEARAWARRCSARQQQRSAAPARQHYISNCKQRLVIVKECSAELGWAGLRETPQAQGGDWGGALDARVFQFANLRQFHQCAQDATKYVWPNPGFLHRCSHSYVRSDDYLQNPRPF